MAAATGAGRGLPCGGIARGFRRRFRRRLQRVIERDILQVRVAQSGGKTLHQIVLARAGFVRGGGCCEVFRIEAGEARRAGHRGDTRFAVTAAACAAAPFPAATGSGFDGAALVAMRAGGSSVA
jgi:hypothetical protein